jgi:hypothetical protein
MLRPKLIYLARRNPDLTAEGFVERWRRHGALGMSLPRWRNIWRYVHCDVLVPSIDVPGLTPGYDGVGLIWHRSSATRRAHREDTGSQAIMEADELDTFAELVRNFCALYEEQTLVDDGADAPVKLFRFFSRATAVTEDRLHEDIAPLAASLALRDEAISGLVRRYVHNYRMKPEAKAWGLGYEWVEEMWFDSLEDAASAQAALLANAPLRRLLAPATAQTVSLLTNDIVLHQVPDTAGDAA